MKDTKLAILTILTIVVLTGCATNQGGPGELKIGPQLASYFDKDKKAQIDPTKPRLDVIIPVFDPGLPESSEESSDEEIWPELRRAEAMRFAHKLKVALEKTGAFGAVRVTPDANATGDLYVLGKIDESDGEDVEIDIEVYDISGEKWISSSFDHEVEEEFHSNIRNTGKDPYDPMFDDAANFIARQLEFKDGRNLAKLQKITELRFGANLSEEAFVPHLQQKAGRYSLDGFPSNDDPMLNRIRSIRVRDQLFVDGLQSHYEDFSAQMNDSYLIWQEQSLIELKAAREAKLKAAGEAAVGILAVGLAIGALAAGANADNPGAATSLATAGVLAGAGGAHMLQKSFQTSKESKVHRDALNELGNSIDSDLAPKVVEMEQETVNLTGTAAEQFVQWRAFLKNIYALERTPDVQL